MHLLEHRAETGQERETIASGLGWELFSQYVRALHEAQPRMFIYENNKSMSKDIRASITETFGFEPICINSALVSAQNRQRLYWVGVRNEDGTYRKASIEQPADQGILLKDVLDSVVAARSLTENEMGTGGGNTPLVSEPVCVASRGRNPENPSSRIAGDPTEQRFEAHEDGKTNTLTSVSKDNLIADPVRVGTMPRERDGVQTQGQAFRIYSPAGKSVALKGQAGDGGGKTGLHATQEKPKSSQRVYEVKDGMIDVNGKRYPIKLRDGRYIIRKLTVTECMRLQTVPEWYDFSCVSNTQAYKMLGNGWTVEVIAHLIRGAIKSSILGI